MKRTRAFLMILLAILPALTLGAADEAKDKVIAPLTFTPYSSAAQFKFVVEASAAGKKDVNAALHFLRAQAKDTTPLPTLSATAAGKDANTTPWFMPKQAKVHPALAAASNLDVSAYKFVPQQATGQLDQTETNTKSSVATSASSAGGFCASYQDIPDWGYVRVYDGIVNQESYNEFPTTSGFNSFWCQSPDRSSGIRVLQPVDMPRPQDRLESYLVFLDGVMYTTPEGERVILPRMVMPITYNFPLSRPMYLPIKGLVTPLAPNGLQVKISGKVVKGIVLPPLDINGNQPASYFYMDDGSGLETDDPTVRGIKVVDPYYGYNWPWPSVGDTIIIIGTRSYETDTAGKVHPIFYRSTDGLNLQDWTGTNYYTISGTVRADADASGQTVWVGCEGGSTTAVFDATGVATYEFRVREGYYNVFARTPGYGGTPEPGHALWCIDAYHDYTEVDFVLEPMDPKRVIDVSTTKKYIDHDGLSTTSGFVLLRACDGARYANQPITLTVTAGQIVWCDPVTDYKGKARFVLRSSNKAEAAVVTAKNGEFAGRTFVYYHEVGEPVLVITNPIDRSLDGGDIVTVSGEMRVDVVCGDLQIDLSDDIVRGQLLVDGKMAGIFFNVSTEQSYDGITYEQAPYLDTLQLSNGPHTLTAKATDTDGNVAVSNEIPFNVRNKVSDITTGPTEIYVDDMIPDTIESSAKVNDPGRWRMAIKRFDDDSIVKATEITDLGQISISWDGKIGGEYAQGAYYASVQALDADGIGQIPELIYRYFGISSKNGKMLIMIDAGTDIATKMATKFEVGAVILACKMQSVPFTIVVNPAWKTTPKRAGMEDIMKHPYAYYYWLLHGTLSGKALDYQPTTVFSDGEYVLANDYHFAIGGKVAAFTNLNKQLGQTQLVVANSCFSGGTWDRPDYSIAAAFQIADLDNLDGGAFIGWMGMYHMIVGDVFPEFGANGSLQTAKFFLALGGLSCDVQSAIIIAQPSGWQWYFALPTGLAAYVTWLRS